MRLTSRHLRILALLGVRGGYLVTQVSDAETDEMEEEHLRGLGYLEWPPATGPRGG